MVFPPTLRAGKWALLFALTVSCDQKSEEPTPSSPTSSPTKAAAAAPADTGSKEPTVKPGTPPGSPTDLVGPACLVGTWHYDFSDSSLETMMSNIEGAKVTKKEGELLCEISIAAGAGTIKCSVKGGKPFVVEVSANQAGLPPMLINFEATGSTTSKFRLFTDKQIQFSEPSLGDLAMKTTVTLAGTPIPFPINDILQAFNGETGSVSSYECKGNELKLRPEVEGTVTGWQILKRVP